MARVLKECVTLLAPSQTTAPLILGSRVEQLHSIATGLGISTENKTAEDLSTLIKEPTTKKPPSHFSSELMDSSDPNDLTKYFEEGRLTDCAIRVTIREAPKDENTADRPAKRLKPEPAEPSGVEARADEAEGVHVIKAHAVILASRSKYFERAMEGEWRESQDRSFEVEVSDEQEYMTFRRLIKLCYGSTFIKEGDRDLDFSELVRLIHVANAFECIDAVKKCVVALINQELDWEGAVKCMELTDMPQLKGMEGGIDLDLAVKAAGVIVKEVGPVHKLFVPSDEEGVPGVLGGLKLSDRVKNLSPGAFESFLFEDLQIKTANEAFWLVLAWVEAQSEESEEGKQALFNRMAKHLSFAAMDPGYILLLVSKHPRVIAAGLESTAIRASLGGANMARRTAAEVRTLNEVDHCDCCLPNAELWGGKVISWTYDVRFSAAEAAAVEPGGQHSKVVGLVAGMPWSVEVKHDTAGLSAKEEGPQAWIFIRCRPPFEWAASHGYDGAGFFFRYSLEVGLGTPRKEAIQEEDSNRCWTGTDESLQLWGGDLGPWEEVFGEGSEWLVNGELHVRLTVTTINDQGPSLQTDVVPSS